MFPYVSLEQEALILKWGGRHGQWHQTFFSRQPGIHGASASNVSLLGHCNITRIFTSSSRMSLFDCSLGLHRLATSSSQQKHEISRTWTLGCAQWALYHMWAFLLSIGFGSNKYDRHWHGWNEAKCLLISLCKQRMQMTQSYKYIQIWSNLLSHDFTDLRIPSSNLDMYRYEYVAITGARTSPWPSSLPSPS